jgi:hypothetical protein
MTFSTLPTPAAGSSHFLGYPQARRSFLVEESDDSAHDFSHLQRQYSLALPPTAPLQITRRKSSTASIESAASSSSAYTSPQTSPNRASFRPLPKVPQAPTLSASHFGPPESPSLRPSELSPSPSPPRLRRLPVPPIRSPGGDDAVLLARRSSQRATRPAKLERRTTRTPDFCMTEQIDWDELGEILCEED